MKGWKNDVSNRQKSVGKEVEERLSNMFQEESRCWFSQG